MAIAFIEKQFINLTNKFKLIFTCNFKYQKVECVDMFFFFFFLLIKYFYISKIKGLQVNPCYPLRRPNQR